MEERKQKEIEYYDKKAQEWFASSQKKWQGDFEGFDPFLLKSYKFLRKTLKNKCQGKKILDYGCGNGVHSTWLAKSGGEVIGIDLSEKSLAIAKERANKEKITDRVGFSLGDCENLDFPEKSFDIVFDGGTFSSIAVERGFSEIARVLKPNGFLIGIETLGHNPFTNLKRRINKIKGKRTEWAAHHIFKIENLKSAGKYFRKTEAYFFHLVSWAAFPFLSLPGGKILLRLLEGADSLLILVFPFLKKYSFKIVFIFSDPKS